MAKKIYSDPELYVQTLQLLEKWTPLIVKNRGLSNLKGVKERTLDIVTRNYKPENGSLEPYVKETALKVDLHKGDVSSIDVIVGEGERNTLAHLLTDANRLDYPIDEGSFAHTIQEGYLWRDWLDYLKEQTVPNRYYSYENILTLISITPALEQLFLNQVDEIVKSENGSLTKVDYREYYLELLSRVAKLLSTTQKNVEPHIKPWVSIFLRNQEVLKNQFALLNTSKITPFLDRKSKSKPPAVRLEFGVDDDYIVTTTEKATIYGLNLALVIDRVFDNYYSETYRTLAFEVDDHTFYNVLGGIFIKDGDLLQALRENICELVLASLNCRYIAMTDKYIYFESKKPDLDVQFFSYYFGVSLPFTLVKFPSRTQIKGDLIHDFTELVP